MRKISAFCGLILVFCSSQGQNLVPNPSFEDVGSCTSFLPPWNSFDLTNWYSPNAGSPDPYNPCFTSSWGLSTPSNYMGYQVAHTGVGYAGIVSCIQYKNEAGIYREYISNKLISPLQAGKKYDVSFYVVRCQDKVWSFGA